MKKFLIAFIISMFCSLGYGQGERIREWSEDVQVRKELAPGAEVNTDQEALKLAFLKIDTYLYNYAEAPAVFHPLTRTKRVLESFVANPSKESFLFYKVVAMNTAMHVLRGKLMPENEWDDLFLTIAFPEQINTPRGEYGIAEDSGDGDCICGGGASCMAWALNTCGYGCQPNQWVCLESCNDCVPTEECFLGICWEDQNAVCWKQGTDLPEMCPET